MSPTESAETVLGGSGVSSHVAKMKGDRQEGQVASHENAEGC